MICSDYGPGLGPASPRLTRRAARLERDGELPLLEGTVIRPAVEKLPSGGANRPVWL
ncbi:hypothetical protein [Streptomyces sp. 16-176A]|uniref:hypothetical protein n=1 Tax=Streptomyces sp. 16-176A TaxID=2530458 RepID=UPI00345C96E7